MDLTQEKVSDVSVVTLQGETFDASHTQDFKEDIVAMLGPKVKMVLDLGLVEFVDSSGCAAILSLLRQLKSTGGDLKLCALTPSVRSLFELTRLHRVFDICDTREAAIQAFHAP